MQRYVFIAVGGALGAVARYQIGAFAAQRFGLRFPAGTLIINVSACLLIGFSIEFLNRHTSFSPGWRYLIPIGFIGAYSTFSTFEWEIWNDITAGAFWIGLSYLIVSLVAGFIAVASGAMLARAVSQH